MHKKSFIRTIEILFVIIITTLFFAYFKNSSQMSLDTEKITYISNLKEDDSFRNLVNEQNKCYSSDDYEITKLVRNYLPDYYDFVLCVNTKPSNLPEKTVFIDSLFLSGNLTEQNYKTVKLYYWVK